MSELPSRGQVFHGPSLTAPKPGSPRNDAMVAASPSATAAIKAIGKGASGQRALREGGARKGAIRDGAIGKRLRADIAIPAGGAPAGWRPFPAMKAAGLASF